MSKKIIKIGLFIIIILIILVFYLSFFGIDTKKFNSIIKDEVTNINKNLNIKLKSVKIKLNPFNLSFNIMTISPDIFLNNHKLELEKVTTNISLKSLINKGFFIDDLYVSTKRTKIKKLILLSRSFNNSTELFILDKVVKQGYIIGDIKLNFDKNGNIKNNYIINGYIENAKLNLLNNNKINNLNLNLKIENRDYLLKEIEAEFNQIQFKSPRIEISDKSDFFLISGELVNKNTTNLSFIADSIKKNNIKKISFSSNNKFTLNISKKFKIKDFQLKSQIDLNNLTFEDNLLNVKKYFLSSKELINLEKHKILINYKNNNFDISGKGSLIINDKSEFIDYKIQKKNDQYNFDTVIEINENPLFLNELDYKKDINIKSLLKLNGFYKNNKLVKFNSVSYKENKNNIIIKDLILDNNFKISDIKLLELNYINKNNIKNQISIKKNNNKYILDGNSFDISSLIDRILDIKNDDSSSIFSNLNSEIKIKISKTYLDELTFINDLQGNIFFENNKIDNLKLDSTFTNKKKITLSINKNTNNEKVTTLYSGYPKPLVKRYKFIKGFEEGILDFYSIKKNGISNSLLIIDNFKVQEVPVLAKLLTLASLQGVADLLTGEGIRFTDFEMKFSTEKQLTKIEEIYAIGPAISILMSGYIEQNKLISLRGTLVPATTINRTIASIPIIGDILVGKKTGEGIFGVSFKIKGPPKDLKTSVNPIKTLTPRFITRTLEKIKK